LKISKIYYSNVFKLLNTVDAKLIARWSQYAANLERPAIKVEISGAKNNKTTNQEQELQKQAVMRSSAKKSPKAVSSSAKVNNSLGGL